MISVEEAKEKVIQFGQLFPIEERALSNAQNYVLANDQFATISLPPFRQSAMDGYAVNLNLTLNQFSIIGEVAAGDANLKQLKLGEGVRIFTGAAVPDTANAVIMQEWVDRNDNVIKLNSSAKELKLEMNIRPVGEQIKQGSLALAKGTPLNGSALGFLQSFGTQIVDVYKAPSIAIIITGNEIVIPGNSLPFGSIYESNSITLKTALEKAGFNAVFIDYAKDEQREMESKIKKAADTHDVVLVSGGISVGDYDFTKTSFEKLGVEQHFYKISQKPGKPLYFGTKDETSFFGLPGNPASALVCLYEYVLPHIRKRCGIANPMPTSFKLPLKDSYTMKGDRSEFLKAKINNTNVEILEGQASSMLHTFALADCLVYIPGHINQILKDELVEVHLI